MGCGGGFLSFDLKREGWSVTALDVDEGVLSVGRKRDPANVIRWVKGTAEKLPFAESSFDVVCMMDVLEHIFEPRVALAEAVRVLKPGGSLIFHTFNKTWISWLFAAKGLDWFIKDSQEHIHDWALFIDPKELVRWLAELGCVVERMEGIHPKIWSLAFLRLVLTRRVPKDFRFEVGGRLDVGYLGCAIKTERQNPHAARSKKPTPRQT